MSTRFATASGTGSAEQACARIIETLRVGLGGEPPALIVAFASTKQPLDAVAPLLKAAFPTATVLGASTAGEFTEQGDTKGAVAAAAISGAFKVFGGMATGVRASPDEAVGRAIDGLPRTVQGYPHRTGILLIDTMAGNCEEATLLAATELGIDVPLVGGAAGDDLKMQSTLVACNERAEADAIVVAQIFSKEPLGVGVCHGHTPLSRPLRVTRASGNVIEEIEGRPAWDVWREETRERARAYDIHVDSLPAEDEGAFLLQFEAGLATGETYKIRAPLSRDAKGAIHFACGVPQGSVIRITESEPKHQIASAREAARRARSKLGGHATVAGAIVFDCICRNLILRDQFSNAVSAMSEELGKVPLAGFETYGEIALDAGDLTGFHNTTSVVLAFPR